MKGSRRRSEPPGLLEEAQGFSQVLLLFRRFRVGSGLGLGLGKNQQKLIAIAQDFGLLGFAKVRIELRAVLRFSPETP